jgi:hypothetical protein
MFPPMLGLKSLQNGAMRGGEVMGNSSGRYLVYSLSNDNKPFEFIYVCNVS